ncbi:helix-turn-helix domain-containing protein [Marinobacter sp.]|uniref:helix-turn-helix domain-containing protein n=1 Tax=Marinobacter sp. TaxID=50741 RepID=UPI00384A6B3D
MADHSDFAKRLQTACENNVHVPSQGKGQQTWLSTRLGISQEAVRRWFTGESRPRPQLLSQLAALLEVDESWLALGITDAPKSTEQRAYSDKAEGVAYICFGLFKAAGYACAFADITEPFDFHAIKHGRHFLVSTACARPKSKNVYITSASNLATAFHLCAVSRECGVFEVLHIPWPLIQQAGRLTSVKWELELRLEKSGGYTLNGKVLSHIDGNGNFLNSDGQEESTK